MKQKINAWFRKHPALDRIKTAIGVRDKIRKLEDVLSTLMAATDRLCYHVPAMTRCCVAAREKLKLIRTISAGKGALVYRFHTPNLHTLKRTNSFFTKEPETLEWIDGFGPDDVLYDIGANIGLYTVYAVLNRKAAHVLAFEPASANYEQLNQNIYLNNVYDRVSALNIAFVEKNCLDYLYLAQINEGSSINNFGERTDYIRRWKSDYRQGCLSFAMDSFIEIFDPPFPTHIKIDVDGLEHKIIEGAARTLADPRLKSVQMEINRKDPKHLELFDVMAQIGFRIDQVEKESAINCHFTRP